MLACNHILHWPTALSTTFCDMLAHVSMRRCFESLVTAAGVTDRCLYNVYTFLHQSTHSVVNQNVWPTQIWRDKIECFLLKELEWKLAHYFFEYVCCSIVVQLCCVVFCVEQLSVSGRAASASKRRTLEDLFRPPLDLLHKGSFKSVSPLHWCCVVA